MIEAFGDFWEIEPELPRCITTNGYVNRHGAAVMGRGVALQAKRRHPGIEFALGKLIAQRGNHLGSIGSIDEKYQGFVSFPVKHHWRENADLDLIAQSCRELVAMREEFLEHLQGLTEEERAYEEGKILLPRPGCGNGGLDWDDVREVIDPLLGDWCLVVTYAPIG